MFIPLFHVVLGYAVYFLLLDNDRPITAGLVGVLTFVNAFMLGVGISDTLVAP